MAAPVVLTLSVDVAAPATQTWAASIDWQRQGEWMLGTRVRATEAGGAGVGGGLVAVTGRPPLGFTDTMTITAWDPPHRCDVLHTGRIVRGTASFRVEERGVDSRFIWTEELTLPGGSVARAGWPALRPFVAAGVGYSLKRFARFARDYSPGAPAA